jgi:hypothetical protein
MTTNEQSALEASRVMVFSIRCQNQPKWQPKPSEIGDTYTTTSLTGTTSYGNWPRGVSEVTR